MITLPRKVTTWLLDQNFSRQVFHFASDVFDALRALRQEQAQQDASIAALEEEIANIDIDGGTPGAHASTHLPSGSDALTTAAAGTITPGATASAGSANSFARSDHRHAIAAFGDGSGEFCEGNDWRLGSTTSGTFTAGAATLDTSASLDFTARLTQNSTLTLTNGVDGRRGKVYVVQDTTGAWDLDFTASGRALLLEEGVDNTAPGAAAAANTVFDYDYQTINGTAYLVIRRTVLGGGLYVLDQIATSALGAFSMWIKLRGAYTGSAIRVRRSSDNAEADIGFTGTGFVDTTALLAHCNGSSGFVTTWYDQSGLGNNWTETSSTAQPRVVNSGVLDLLASHPGIRTDGSNDKLSRTDAFGLTGSPALTVGWASKTAGTSSTIAWSVGGSSANQFFAAFPPDASDSPAGAVLGQGGTAFRAFTGAVAQNSVGYHIAGKASSATPSAFTLEANGSALSQQSVGAGGATAMSMANTAARIGCHSNGTTNFCQETINCWFIFNAVLSGSDLTALRGSLAAHAA